MISELEATFDFHIAKVNLLKNKATKHDKMSLLVQDVAKNQRRNNHLKLEETSPMENGANVLEEK